MDTKLQVKEFMSHFQAGISILIATAVIIHFSKMTKKNIILLLKN